MKALTVWQPWASLIAIGAKPYEFRGWQPPRALIGRRIAIHAGARPARRSELYALERSLRLLQPPAPCLRADVARPFLDRAIDNPRILQLSAILCTAILGEPRRGDECARQFGIAVAGNDSDRDDHFNWGWPLSYIKPCEPPVPARGAQGFWDFPDNLLPPEAR